MIKKILLAALLFSFSSSVFAQAVTPIITGVSTLSAKPGDNIVIIGNGFTADSKVIFQEADANPNSWTGSTLSFTIPANATNGGHKIQIHRLQDNMFSNEVSINVNSALSVTGDAKPSISSFTVNGIDANGAEIKIPFYSEVKFAWTSANVSSCKVVATGLAESTYGSTGPGANTQSIFSTNLFGASGPTSVSAGIRCYDANGNILVQKNITLVLSTAFPVLQSFTITPATYNPNNSLNAYQISYVFNNPTNSGSVSVTAGCQTGLTIKYTDGRDFRCGDINNETFSTISQSFPLVFINSTSQNMTESILLSSAGMSGIEKFITVVPSQVSSTQTIVTNGTDEAQCVTIDAPSTVSPGQNFNVSVNMKNTGTNTWQDKSILGTQAYQLAFTPQPSTNFSGSVLNDLPIKQVFPNGNAIFSLNFTATKTPGTYPLQLQMMKAGGSKWFVQGCKKDIIVTNDVSSIVPPATQAISVSTFSPLSVVAGQSVSVIGSGFSTGVYVSIDDKGGASINPQVNSDSSLTFIVPSNYGSGPHTFRVVQKAGTISSSAYTFNIQVSVISVSNNIPTPSLTFFIDGSEKTSTNFIPGSTTNFSWVSTNTSYCKWFGPQLGSSSDGKIPTSGSQNVAISTIANPQGNIFMVGIQCFDVNGNLLVTKFSNITTYSTYSSSTGYLSSCSSLQGYSSTTGLPCSGVTYTTPTPANTSTNIVSDIDPNNSQSCVVLSYDIRYKSKDATTGGQVSDLQDFLSTNGFLNSEPTGYAGIMTIAAVKNFQIANSINPSGFVGSITRAKIKALSCK